jgi:pyruvate dehydrogenase E2 component (dihydrolipoamide acetyltransferase)
MSVTMIKEFRLPDLGEGLTESEILSWKVAVGDTVSLNQVIAEVETAKAVVELPSPFAGVIRELHEQPGTVVEVGKPIVSFEVLDDAGPAPAGHAAPSRGVTPDGQTAAGEEPASPKREPNLVGYGAVVESSGRPARRPRNLPPVVEPAGTTVIEARAGVPSGDRPRSTPPVRKLARDHGVDLALVTGTGPAGLITREDVQEFLRLGSAGQAALPAGQVRAGGEGERETRMPIKGVRKHTAAAMVSSAFTAPHVTEFLTVDVTPTMELLAKLRGTRTFSGLKLTPLTLAAKAVLIALRRNPSLNSRWDEANQEIVTFNYVNLGIAAATPRGLTVPNIKDAHSLTLEQLAEALALLADTARSGKTAPADLSGGTMSITNIGVFGIDAGTPILNPGEAAILALGAVRSMPWEYRGEVALRQVMTLSLSFDHRLVDGEQGSRFLADVGALLADPGLALAF